MLHKAPVWPELLELLPQRVSDGDLSEGWLYQTLDITKTITRDTLTPQLYITISFIIQQIRFYSHLGRQLIFTTHLHLCSSSRVVRGKKCYDNILVPATQSLKLPAGLHHCYSLLILILIHLTSPHLTSPHTSIHQTYPTSPHMYRPDTQIHMPPPPPPSVRTVRTEGRVWA